jgi:hypothetical protein
LAYFTTLPDTGTGVRHRLPFGPKIVNALTANIRRNAAERTDAHPMFVVRYQDVAFLCKSFREVGAARTVRAVCGALRPIATVTQAGVDAANPVTAFLVTDAPLELECCPDTIDRIHLSGEHCVEADLARCAVEA